ncbi:MAG: IS30 family transposase [Spirochaetota bacterium]
MFFKRKNDKKRANVYKNRYADIGKKRIDERPLGAHNRSEVGHFEGDLIESKRKDAYLPTLVDRMSAYSIALKLPSKDAETVTRAIIEAADDMPPKSIKTHTFDNGKEFSTYRSIEEVLGCEVYFAVP